ncbi:MAG: DUF3189 family protein [Firmicutes bacterium]|nr:DUF3189 family protein [Bacillota bacterium]
MGRGKTTPNLVIFHCPSGCQAAPVAAAIYLKHIREYQAPDALTIGNLRGFRWRSEGGLRRGLYKVGNDSLGRTVMVAANGGRGSLAEKVLKGMAEMNGRSPTEAGAGLILVEAGRKSILYRLAGLAFRLGLTGPARRLIHEGIVSQWDYLRKAALQVDVGRRKLP